MAYSVATALRRQVARTLLLHTGVVLKQSDIIFLQMHLNLHTFVCLICACTLEGNLN